ncbi:MAG: hypothetical protein ACK5WV_08555 [Chryseotalea sp.]
MKKVVIIFFLGVSLMSHAQENFFTSADPFGLHKSTQNFFNSADPFHLHGKNHKSHSDSITIKPSLAVNIGVTPLLGYFSTLQVGFEHKVKDNINLHYEFGKVVHAENGSDKNKRSGYRLRVEPRYYFRHDPYQALYVSSELFYNHLVDQKNATFGINCPNGQCDYFQYVSYQNVYNDFGALLKIGTLINIHVASGMFIDLNVGFGFRSRDVSTEGEPQGSSVINFDSYNEFEPSFEDYTGLHMNLGFRIGYRFK